MKLHELRTFKKSAEFQQQVTLEPAEGIYGPVLLDVEFDISAGGHTQHEPDNSSFREYHSDEVEIQSVALAQEVDEYDVDGEQVIKVWPKGTAAQSLPGWSAKDSSKVLDLLETPEAEDDY